MNTGAFPEMGYTEGGADLGENQEFAFIEFEVRIIVQVERQSCLHLCAQSRHKIRANFKILKRMQSLSQVWKNGGDFTLR